MCGEKSNSIFFSFFRTRPRTFKRPSTRRKTPHHHYNQFCIPVPPEVIPSSPSTMMCHMMNRDCKHGHKYLRAIGWQHGKNRQHLSLVCLPNIAYKTLCPVNEDAKHYNDNNINLMLPSCVIWTLLLCCSKIATETFAILMRHSYYVEEEIHLWNAKTLIIKWMLKEHIIQRMSEYLSDESLLLAIAIILLYLNIHSLYV